MESCSSIKVEKYAYAPPPLSDDEEEDYEYLSSGSESDDMFTENSMAALLYYLRWHKQYDEDWDESETDTPEEELSNVHNMSCNEQSDEDWDMCELDTPVDLTIPTEEKLSNVHNLSCNEQFDEDCDKCEPDTPVDPIIPTDEKIPNVRNMSCCTEQSDEDWDKCEPDTPVDLTIPTEEKLSNVHNMSCCTEQSHEDRDKSEPDIPVDPIIFAQVLSNVPENIIEKRCAPPFLVEKYRCLPSEIEDYKPEISKKVYPCSENDEDTDDSISDIQQPLAKKVCNVVKNNNIISNKKHRIIPRHLDTYYFDSSDSDEEMITINSSRVFMGDVCRCGTLTDD